jgi:hypothetical protein
VDELGTLPLWFNLSISTSPRFSGTATSSTSTCLLRASFQLGIAGSASSFTGLLCASKVANCGCSGDAGRANFGLTCGLKFGLVGCRVNVGVACDWYCVSICGGGGGGGANERASAYGFGEA